MRSANEVVDLYAQSHTHPANRLLHYIGVPPLVFALVGAAQHVPAPSTAWAPVDWAWVAVAVAVVMYGRLSLTVGLGMATFLGFALWANPLLAATGIPHLALCLVVGSLGFALQGLGHRIERRLVEGAAERWRADAVMVVTSPAWVLSVLYRGLGIPVETWGRGDRR